MVLSRVVYRRVHPRYQMKRLRSRNRITGPQNCPNPDSRNLLGSPFPHPPLSRAYNKFNFNFRESSRWTATIAGHWDEQGYPLPVFKIKFYRIYRLLLWAC